MTALLLRRVAAVVLALLALALRVAQACRTLTTTAQQRMPLVGTAISHL